jgi:hypothetical protein
MRGLFIVTIVLIWLAALVIIIDYKDSGSSRTAQAKTIHSKPIFNRAPVPMVSGNKIINARTKRRFVPRGVNWPSFEYACAQGWDYSNPGADLKGIKALKSWRINTVRIPINQDCWLGEDGYPSGNLKTLSYRNSLTKFVGLLNQQGVVVILDLHWSGPQGVQADGLLPMPDSRSIVFWKSLAKKFIRYKSVIFDVFNEPHSRWNPDKNEWEFTLSWSCWKNGSCLAPIENDTEFPITGDRYQAFGMNQLVKAVRSTGARQPIILSGRDYANDVKMWKKYAPKDRQLIVGFHNYTEQLCKTTQCWNKTVLPLSRRVPVLATEFGQNDCRANHIKKFVRWADRYLIGYLAWAWWELPGLGCRNFALINKLNGQPTAGYGAFYKSHLVNIYNKNRRSVVKKKYFTR